MTDTSTPTGMPGPRWKGGNEYLPFHPQASHVRPDYRDGWNDCYAAALAAKASPEDEATAAWLEDMGVNPAVASMIGSVVDAPDPTPTHQAPGAKPLTDEEINDVQGASAGRADTMNAPPTPEAIIRAALEIAIDLAICEAAHVHAAYAGYKPHRHAAVDRDVETIKAALAQLDELSGQIAALWEQLAHRDRIAEDLRAATAAERGGAK